MGISPREYLLDREHGAGLIHVPAGVLVDPAVEDLASRHAAIVFARRYVDRTPVLAFGVEHLARDRHRPAAGGGALGLGPARDLLGRKRWFRVD
jgi:hypothetical protein